MIIYKGISEDKKTIFYSNISSNKVRVRIEVHDSYTNTLVLINYLDLDPNISYYTHISSPWDGTKIIIYNDQTNEIVAPYVIINDKSLLEYDQLNYIKKLFQKNSNNFLRQGIYGVISEHLYNRQYSPKYDIEYGDIVIDIGFNYGIFSLGALYRGASRVFGFEPNKQIFNFINENYPEKQKVKIYNMAVSNQNTIVQFNEDSDTISSNIFNKTNNFKNSYDVRCINFYDFLMYEQIDKIDFLKVDCEGAEYQIFDTIPDEFFCKIKKIHVEFHFNDGNKVLSLIDKLDRNDFIWEYENGVNQNNEIGLIFAKNKNV